MTIKELVQAQKPMGINEWLEFIKSSNLTEYEHLILECANYYNLITINHNASFIDAINIK